MNPDTAGQDLSQNKQSNLRSTNITLVILAGFFVGLRFLSRWKKRAYIGIDDCFILLAYAALLSLLSAGLLMIHYGLGVHADALDFDQLIAVGKGLLAFECIYVTTVALTKVSLLLMYYRIFPIDSMRISCWILGTLSVCWCISIIMVSIFQCTPIAKAWNLTIPGHCINLKGSFIGNAVPNILTDVAILGLPMPHVWRLHTTLIQRCQLSAVFLLGSFVVFTNLPLHHTIRIRPLGLYRDTCKSLHMGHRRILRGDNLCLLTNPRASLTLYKFLALAQKQIIIHPQKCQWSNHHWRQRR